MILKDVIGSEFSGTIRAYRDNLLKNTDWVLTYDNALSLANLDEWIKYRQDLRDFFSDLNKPVIFRENSIFYDIHAMGFPIKQPPIIRKNTNS